MINMIDIVSIVFTSFNKSFFQEERKKIIHDINTINTS